MRDLVETGGKQLFFLRGSSLLNTHLYEVSSSVSVGKTGDFKLRIRFELRKL